ncbi:MAG: glycosyltransferase family 2 protein [Myxococcota bacterium]
MISAFVITYNSERYLKRCLSSISFADEIIVVDSNSTDSTINIAKHFNAKTINIEFVGFSEKKEFAKRQCKYEWILNIDADEYLPKETKEEILRVIEENKYDAFSIPFETYFQDRLIKYGRHKNESHIRLFKKEFEYGEEKVHEKIKGSKNVGRLKNKIIHTPYLNIDNIKEKAIRNAKLASIDKAKINIIILIFSLFFNPIFRFFKEYIFLLGFLDKEIGFHLAFNSSKEVFLKYFWGLKKRFSPSS